MTPLVDYHIHTTLCNHATGSSKEYIEHALKMGLKEIGFSDHAPLVSHRDPSVTMDFSDLPEYYAIMENARSQYKNEIIIKRGIEADFIPGYEEKTKAILDEYPYDYVYGSVHYIKKWGFDDPIQRQKWEDKNIDEVYQAYFELLRQSAMSGLFDIMGHVDLIKKFGHRAKQDLKDDIHKTAEVFKECGVAIEINTSGLRKQVKEIYPSQHDLKIYSEHNVPIVFGSDAHAPEQVAMNYTEAVELAQSVGYTEYLTFKNRKVENTLR